MLLEVSQCARMRHRRHRRRRPHHHSHRRHRRRRPQIRHRRHRRRRPQTTTTTTTATTTPLMATRRRTLRSVKRTQQTPGTTRGQSESVARHDRRMRRLLMDLFVAGKLHPDHEAFGDLPVNSMRKVVEAPLHLRRLSMAGSKGREGAGVGRERGSGDGEGGSEGRVSARAGGGRESVRVGRARVGRVRGLAGSKGREGATVGRRLQGSGGSEDIISRVILLPVWDRSIV